MALLGCPALFFWSWNKYLRFIVFVSLSTSGSAGQHRGCLIPFLSDVLSSFKALTSAKHKFSWRLWILTLMTEPSALAWHLSYSSCKKLGQFLVFNQQNSSDLDVSKNRSGKLYSMLIIVFFFSCSYYMVWLYFCLKKQNSFTNEYKKMYVFSWACMYFAVIWNLL